MRLSLFLQGLMLLIFPFALSFWPVLLITLGWALTSEAYKPSSSAYITNLTDENQRKVSFSLNRSAINAGTGISMSLGSVLVAVTAHLIFVANSVASILAGLFLSYTLREEGAQNAQTRVKGSNRQGNQYLKVLKDPRLLFFPIALLPSLAGRLVKDIKERRLLYFLIALFPAFVVFFQYRAAMPLYLGPHLQATTPAYLTHFLNPYPLLIGVNTLIAVIFYPTVNSRLEKTPERLSMSAGAFLIGAGYGSFAFVRGFFSAAACVVVWTLGEIVLFASSDAHTAKIAGKSSGKYMGFYHMSINLAAIAAPIFGRILKPDVPKLWGVTFVMGCLSAVMLLFLAKPDGSGQSGPPLSAPTN
jgi:predicted MFS family arabinose efflux permease